MKTLNKIFVPKSESEIKHLRKQYIKIIFRLFKFHHKKLPYYVVKYLVENNYYFYDTMLKISTNDSTFYFRFKHFNNDMDIYIDSSCLTNKKETLEYIKNLIYE